MPKQNQPTAGGFKPYPEYKPTGLAWLHEVPRGWKIMRLKSQFDERKENNKSGDGLMILSLMKDVGVIPYDEKGNVGNKSKDDISQYKVARKGDLVLNSMNVIIGSVGVSAYDGLISPAYYSLMPRPSADVRYFDFLFHLPSVQQAIRGCAKGIMEIRLRISTVDLLGMKFPVPPPDEQQRIVAYLDEKTAKIDRLIQLKEHEIELLNEKKQAMISKVVSGKFAVVGFNAETQSHREGGATSMKSPPLGLRPRRDNELVDSGVDWIGKVPRGWKVSSVRRHCSSTLGKMLQNEQHTSSDSLESYLCAKDVHFTGVDLSELKKMWFSQNEKDQYRVHNGDLLIVEGGAGAGGAALMHKEVDVYVQNSVHIVRAIGNDVCLSYVWYWLFSLVKRNYIDCVSNKATIPHFTKELVLSVPLPVPPLPEQREIVAYLDAATANIDAAVAAIEKGIGLLKERRTRLVSDAVTGRIDLRKEVA